MEIWFNTDKRKVRLPVLPPELIINGSIIETSVNMLGQGEVSVYGGNKLQENEISCFFPAEKNKYDFLQYKDPANPYFFVKIFREWMNNGQTVQFVVTPGIASFPVRITSFEYGEKNGNGDVYYTFKWKEVGRVNIKKINSNSNTSNTQRPPSQTQDKADSNKQRTYTVKKGDNLWDIAQKYYGKGSDFTKIQNANTSKYPSLKNNPSYIKDGWVLVIP